MTIIVYKTTNKINNKFYLGVHNCHATCKSKYSKDCKYLGSGFVLKKAIKKYGRLNFIRETLMEFDTSEEAYDYEAWLVNDYMINRPDCYNIQVGGNSGPRLFGMDHPKYGTHHSEETRSKISKANTGRTYPPITSETRALLSETQKDLWADEHVRTKRISRLTGREVSSETRLKISNANTGKTRSDESKRNISDSKLGSIPWNKGSTGLVNWGDEQRIQYKDSITDYWQSDKGRTAKENISMRTKGIPQEQRTCPHCNKSGGHTMGRWHFDNCKYRRDV